MARRVEEKVRVKILRCFQDYELGSIVDIPKSRFAALEHRKMVEIYAAPQALEKVVVEEKEVESNRAVGLKKSEKKLSKRAK